MHNNGCYSIHIEMFAVFGEGVLHSFFSLYVFTLHALLKWDIVGGAPDHSVHGVNEITELSPGDHGGHQNLEKRYRIIPLKTLFTELGNVYYNKRKMRVT